MNNGNSAIKTIGLLSVIIGVAATLVTVGMVVGTAKERIGNLEEKVADQQARTKSLEDYRGTTNLRLQAIESDTSYIAKGIERIERWMALPVAERRHFKSGEP